MRRPTIGEIAPFWCKVTPPRCATHASQGGVLLAHCQWTCSGPGPAGRASDGWWDTIQHGDGVSAAERYLQGLCDHSSFRCTNPYPLDRWDARGKKRASSIGRSDGRCALALGTFNGLWRYQAPAPHRPGAPRKWRCRPAPACLRVDDFAPARRSAAHLVVPQSSAR